MHRNVFARLYGAPARPIGRARFALLTLALAWGLGLPLAAQSGLRAAPSLADPSGLRLDTLTIAKDHPTLEVQMSESARVQMLESRGAKVEVTSATLLIGGRRVEAESFRMRGRSSLNYRRKSYTVELEERLPIPFDEDTLELRKFYLVSMNMDHHYFHNRLSFACLSKLGLFNLQTRYVELRINRQSQGIYLLLERPEDHIFDHLGGPYFLRRGYKNAIEEDEFDGELSDEYKAACRQQYHEIFLAVDSLQGEDLLAYLDARLNLRDYLRWMAFNYWVRNGDYSDEVFFYLDTSDDGRFHIMGWDYDDIFAEAPHEGANARAQWLGDQMIFSAESTLDRAIGSDPVLYGQYRRELRYVLEALSEPELAGLCTAIYARLAPFYRKRSITRQARYDRGGSTSLEEMRAALNRVYDEYLVGRRRTILQRLDAEGY